MERAISHFLGHKTKQLSGYKFLFKQNRRYIISGVFLLLWNEQILLFICCQNSKNFWAEVIRWLDNQGVKDRTSFHRDMLFGILRCEDDLFVNHTLLAVEQYFYSCRQDMISPPSIKAFNCKMINQLATMIAKLNNEVKAHNMTMWNGASTKTIRLI